MSTYGDKTIYDLVREMESSDKNGETTSSRYVSFNLREDINKTDAYINSKHISGETDYLGREKPFFNIVMAARNIWYRATDIDRKNIVIRATKASDEVKAFLATILLQQWMKKTAFGRFLNDWGLTLSTHGSAITKFIEKDGELHCQVMDWNNMIIDPVDFENNPKIEKIWMTPAQLKQREGYDQELVDKLIEALTVRKTTDGQQKDNKADYIPIYEIHGELPLSYLTGKDKDDDTFVQQIHVLSFQACKDSTDKYDEYSLYSGKENKDPYLLSHLIKKEGQSYAGGSVKNLFEAQWMVNHSEKMIKDQLDLASKIVFQTSDGAFVGQNVLTNIENGDILNHKQNEPLTRLAGSPDIVAMQSFKADWQNISLQINGISEAMAGQNAPSGSAWRQTQALLQESHSLFELMTENKGLAIIEMLTKYVIPYFKKQLNTTEEISTILEDYQIKQIDTRFIPNTVIRIMNEKKKKIILSGQVYDPMTEEGEVAKTEQELKSSLTGNQRFIKPSEIESKTWKEVLKDSEWELDIDVTGEARDTQAALSTLTTVLQTLTTNPAVLQDPNVKLIFSKILGLAGGISPLEIQSIQQAQPVPQMPQMANAMVGRQQMPITNQPK